jgi:hypothetical protein
LLVFAVAPVLAQVGFDRRGGDYANFVVRSGDPAVCAARCEREGRCRAWNFRYPADGQPGMCWLKTQVPQRAEDTCCTSGVKGAGVIEPRNPKIEFSIDRYGGDYRSLPVGADARGETCRTICEGDNRCRAWTYVRPGYGGSAPRCYLKEKVMPPRPRPCCISGVIR